MKTLKVRFSKSGRRIPGTFMALLLVVSTLLVILPTMLTGCDPLGAKGAAEIIADVIPQLTGESEQWRKVWEETRDKLPEEVRHQGDLAIQRAVDAAGAEFKCDVDFIRTRLRQDFERIRANYLKQEVSPPVPHICSVWPESVIELDDDLRPKDKRWIRFVGYDLDGPDVQILLESKNGQTRDLSKCCLDDPTHYIITVDLDEVSFTSEHRRIILKWESGQKTVAINHPPPTLVFDYKIELRTWDQEAAPAAADGHVWVTLVGTKRSTDETEILGNFRRGDIEARVITSKDIGDFRYVKIRYDDGKDNNAWHLDWIRVTNLTTNQQLFGSRCDQWYGHQGPLEGQCP